MSLERTNGRGPQPEVWTTEAFLEHFLRVHHQMPERDGILINVLLEGGRTVEHFYDASDYVEPDSQHCSDIRSDGWSK